MSTTTESRRIDLPFTDTDTRRGVVLKECHILLHDTYLQYKIVANYESTDNAEGIWKTVKSNYKWTRLRKDISSVEMLKDTDDGKWYVSIEFAGVEKANSWGYDEAIEASSFYNALVSYFLKQPL